MDLTSLKGGSDPRSEDTSEAGLWRLDRPQTGVAPALFMTPRAALCRPRLLMDVILLPLFTDDKDGPFTGPQPGPNQLSAWSADPARFHAVVIGQRSSEEPMVSSQQIGSERTDSRPPRPIALRTAPRPAAANGGTEPRTSGLGLP